MVTGLRNGSPSHTSLFFRPSSIANAETRPKRPDSALAKSHGIWCKDDQDMSKQD